MSSVESTDADQSLSAEVIAPVPRISIHAFCDSQSLSALIQNAAQDRRMDKAAVRTNMGGLAAALATYREDQTPNVIVLESSTDRDSFLSNLDALAQYCDDGTRVVVVGRANDIAFYRLLMARGVSEYLVEPFNVVDFIRVISELYSKPGKGVLGRVVAVYGARGGVGASTVAHHTAWSIATKAEISTVLVDCDLPFGTAGLDFNQDPPQGIADAVYAPDRLDINMLDRLMTKCNDRLSMLSAPATLERNYDFEVHAFDGILDLLRTSAPMIVLDLPHAWTSWCRRLLVGADEVVVVAAPDLANLRNLKNIQDAIGPARSNDGKIKLVMNMIGVPKRPEITVKEFSSSINLEPAAVFPFDAKLFGAAANNGQMVPEISGGARIGQLFEDFGRLVCGKPELKRSKSGLLESLKSSKLGLSFGKKS
jgi:pilus assembly protein CpaE